MRDPEMVQELRDREAEERRLLKDNFTLRRELTALKAENERLRARVAELEGELAVSEGAFDLAERMAKEAMGPARTAPAKTEGEEKT